MDDIEKNRATYVNQLEIKTQHLQAETERYKAIADKWEPRLTVTTDTASGKVSFGLEFGGKRVHATVNQDWLAHMDTTSGTSSIVDALISGLVADQLRQVVAPEFERVARAAKAVQGAGKW